MLSEVKIVRPPSLAADTPPCLQDVLTAQVRGAPLATPGIDRDAAFLRRAIVIARRAGELICIPKPQRAL